MVSERGTIETTGIITKILGNNNYTVEVENEEGQTQSVLCHLGGKMRRFKINVLTGDTVKVTIPPPYDRGRITFREKT